MAVSEHVCVLCPGLKESVRTGALVPFSPQGMQPTYKWLQALDLRKMLLAAPSWLPKLRRQQGVQKYLHDGHAQNRTILNRSQLSRWTSFPSELLCEVQQVTWASHTGTVDELKKIYCGIWMKETTEKYEKKEKLRKQLCVIWKFAFTPNPGKKQYH